MNTVLHDRPPTGATADLTALEVPRVCRLHDVGKTPAPQWRRIARGSFVPTMLLAAAIVLAWPQPAAADLCAACKGKMFTADVGTCTKCGKDTASRAFKLCVACSVKLRQCQACGASLAAADTPAQPAEPTEPPKRVRRPALTAPIKLVDHPVGEVVNGVLVLTATDGGQTARPVVGQDVVVRLGGDKVSGWTWKFGKASSDAVAQVGKVRVISPETSEGMLGGMNVFEFRFKAVKTGTAVLTFLGARPWEWEKNQVQTWKVTLDVGVDPKVRAASRLKDLKANVSHLVVRLDYVGPEEKPEPFYQLVLHVPKDEEGGKASVLKAALTPAEAGKLVEFLDDSGFLACAAETLPKVDRGYVLSVTAGKTSLYADLGWRSEMLARLDALAKVLQGEPAKAMGTLLDRLIVLRKEWLKVATEGK